MSALSNTLKVKARTTIAASAVLLTGLGVVLGMGLQSGPFEATGKTEGIVKVQRAPGDTAQAEFVEKLPARRIKELQELTSTPAKRDKLVKALQDSFAGVAEVGIVVDEPTTAAPSEPGFRPVAYVEPVLAYGATWNHVWITASYADMARGAIWGAVAYCKTRAPAWLCTYAGNVLTSWANGWGWASNHGVWAELYYYGEFRGGRW